MPRPRKVGLDYFPVDVNRRNDFKIMDLLNEFGPLGYTVYDFCLQYIYSNGYYLNAPIQQVILLLVKDIGAKWIKNKDLVEQVIYYCADIGLFDNALLRQNIITSVGIQRRYNEVTVRNKADKTKFWLLDKSNKNEQKNELAEFSVSENPENVAETPENVAETPENVAEMQQRKEKESKVNKIKNISVDDNSSTDNERIFISLPLNDKTMFDVFVTDIERYKELYPAVNVEQELRGMCGWLEANTRNRKTRAGIKRFVNNWLNKAQNQGGKGYGFNTGHTQEQGISSYRNPNIL